MVRDDPLADIPDDAPDPRGDMEPDDPDVTQESPDQPRRSTGGYIAASGGAMLEPSRGAMELPEQIEKLREFFEVSEHYLKELHEQVRKGHAWLNIEFSDLARHSPELADLLLEQPEEILKAWQIAIEKMDLPAHEGVVPRIEVRVMHLPKQQTIEVRNVRSKHLNKLYQLVGVVRQKSPVRPQMTSARFECPSCGNVLAVLQVDQKFKEPTRCGCGRKGKFKLLSKELVDAQSITLEEAPEDLDGGEQPKRLKLLLKNDLVAPLTDRRTNPGTKITIVGVIKEVPIVLQTGGQSTNFDLMVEVNHVESIQEEFGEIIISPEEEQEIKELSQDPDLLEKFVASIAPSIYGHEPIKQALLLQMFGGVHKSRDRGVKSRGDIHILLIGDPGSGKCVTGDTLVQFANGSIMTMRDAHERYRGAAISAIAAAPNAQLSVPTIDEYGHAGTSAVPTLWRRTEHDDLLRITLRSGERITTTIDHPFFTCKDANIIPIAAAELRIGTPIATPRRLIVQAAPQPLLSTWRRSRANNAVHITTPVMLTPSLARLLGYLAGDGWIQKGPASQMLSVTNNDAVVLDDVATILRSLGANPTIRQPHIGKTALEVYTCSSELASLLEQNAPELVRLAGEKSVPRIIQQSPDDVVVEFLRALFECDAHNNKKVRSVEYSTKSRRMASEIRMLLLRFGLHSQLREKQKRATNGQGGPQTYFDVVLSGRDADEFNARIGFVSERKRAVRHSSPYNTNKDLVPGIGRVLRTLRAQHRRRIIDMSIPAGSYRHYERGDRQPSREQLTRILAAYPADATLTRQLRTFAAADVFWDDVVAVDTIKTGSQGVDVFDFEVERVHNFVANGIVIHNSQLLKRVSGIAPKARFVSGKGASGAGLTAAVVKDDFLKGWTLEAGALVLANRGLCCIDELDKMTKDDTSAMHEALEQQTISISKANIQATLRCETTVLAAANPKFGRFDPYEMISKQIDLPPALINRFDLIFPVRDLPDKNKDEKLASFILNLHKEKAGGQEGLIGPDLIKRYIAYARQHSFPKLTDSASNELKDYYVKMRGGGDEKATEMKAVPISARQLEALVRLAEASARLRLSDKVTKRDAQTSIELVHYCLQQIGIDPDTGKIDIDRITTGISASQRSHISMVKEIIAALETTIGKVIPIEDVVREAGIKGIADDTAHDVIEKLKRGGDIYSPKHGFVSRL
jgi:replicative DNA helicase Mcm